MPHFIHIRHNTVQFTISDGLSSTLDRAILSLYSNIILNTFITSKDTNK